MMHFVTRTLPLRACLLLFASFALSSVAVAQANSTQCELGSGNNSNLIFKTEADPAANPIQTQTVTLQSLGTSRSVQVSYSSPPPGFQVSFRRGSLSVLGGTGTKVQLDVTYQTAFGTIPQGSFINFNCKARGLSEQHIRVDLQTESSPGLTLQKNASAPVASDLKVEPTSLSFGQVSQKGEKCVTFTNTGQSTLTLGAGSLNPAGGDFSLTFKGGRSNPELRPKDIAEACVTYAPKSSNGSYTSLVLDISDDQNIIGHTAPVTISGDGRLGLDSAFVSGSIREHDKSVLIGGAKNGATYGLHLNSRDGLLLGSVKANADGNQVITINYPDLLIRNKGDQPPINLFLVLEGDSPLEMGPLRQLQAPDDPQAPGRTKDFFYSFVGGYEQVGLASQPSQAEPFFRAFLQSGKVSGVASGKGQIRVWGSVRLLGTPNQNDTTGIFTVLTDPTGQVSASKLSSVGAGMDAVVGGAIRVSPNGADFFNSVDFIWGLGATKPFTSDSVAQAFTVPPLGTNECGTLIAKITQPFYAHALGQTVSNAVAKSTPNPTAGVPSSCLVNLGATVSSISNGQVVTNYASVTSLAYSNSDRSSFLLKDMAGIRFNHTAKADSTKRCGAGVNETTCFLGQLDFTVGNDAAVTGGVLRGNRWVYKIEGVFPVVVKDKVSLYVFGSLFTRIERNNTNNVPLILQTVPVGNLSPGGTSAVPNINTLVLPLQQPDRDLYRIGVGIDVLSLFKSSK